MKKEDQIDWWTWLTAGAPQLSAMLDVSPKNIPRAREQRTGLRKPLSPQWVQMVGRWGGQMLCEEVSKLVGVPSRNVRSYAQHWGVTLCRRGMTPLYQVEVALRVFEASAQGAPEDVALHARQCHILPPELLHYRKQMPRFEALMMESKGVTLRGLFEEYTLESAQKYWEVSGCALQIPGSVDRVEESKRSPTIAARLRRGQSTKT